MSMQAHYEPAQIQWDLGLDRQDREQLEIIGRAQELEIELTVEALQERLDEFGLAGLRDRLDEILMELAEKELENWKRQDELWQ